MKYISLMDTDTLQEMNKEELLKYIDYLERMIYKQKDVISIMLNENTRYITVVDDLIEGIRKQEELYSNISAVNSGYKMTEKFTTEMFNKYILNDKEEGDE